MAKQIRFKYEDTDYTLEFNRRAVRDMEAAGFDISAVDRKPLTFMSTLFAGAFKMHHRFVKANKIDEMQGLFADKDKLVERLMEMYTETLDSVSNNSGDSDKENLIAWSTND